MATYDSYMDSGVKWLGQIPSHWEMKTLRHFLRPFSEKNYPDAQLLSVTRDKGVIVRGAKGEDDNHNVIPEDLSGYKHVCPGDFIINKMKSWQGSYGVSDYDGIVSPAYFTYHLDFPNKKFFSMALRSIAYIPFFMQYSKGIRVDQWDLTPDSLKNIPFFLPTSKEQQAIVEYLDKVTGEIDRTVEAHQKMIDALNERKQIIITRAFQSENNDWDYVPFRHVFEMRGGYTPSKADPSLWENGSIPWYRMEDIRKSGRFLNEAIQYVNKKAVKAKGPFKAGSYIMAICTASIGEHAMLIADSLANQQFANLKIRKSL
ncbi:MAG: restriction endonuclease subunit S, partial [Muribaculum sp.]|nr:restriction endonuclease subunit S [Muribaculum sp.]